MKLLIYTLSIFTVLFFTTNCNLPKEASKVEFVENQTIDVVAPVAYETTPVIEKNVNTNESAPFIMKSEQIKANPVRINEIRTNQTSLK